MQTPIRIQNGIEGHITPEVFRDLTQGKISDERFIALLEDQTIRSFKIGNIVIIDISSVRRWLATVHPVTLEPARRDLFS